MSVAAPVKAVPVEVAPIEAATPRAGDLDSRARTHLANERTFLAWLRTGLSIIALGMAAARFLPLGLIPGFPYVRIFAVLLVVSGTAAVGFGARRYVVASQSIESGAFRPAMGPIVAAAGVVSVLGLMALILVLALR